VVTSARWGYVGTSAARAAADERDRAAARRDDPGLERGVRSQREQRGRRGDQLGGGRGDGEAGAGREHRGSAAERGDGRDEVAAQVRVVEQRREHAAYLRGGRGAGVAPGDGYGDRGRRHEGGQVEPGRGRDRGRAAGRGVVVEPAGGPAVDEVVADGGQRPEGQREHDQAHEPARGTGLVVA
jgi:hypothetical protein